MSAQSKALWLADWLDVRACGGNEWNAKMNAAAAELRRLHAQRDALLSLLSSIRGWDVLDATADGAYWKREIDSAIKAAKE